MIDLIRVHSDGHGDREGQIVQRVVLDGRTSDLNRGMREFTDWAVANAGVVVFLRIVLRPDYPQLSSIAFNASARLI